MYGRIRDHVSPPRKGYWLLTTLSILISCIALAFYSRHNSILLYGDAVAHTNIARHIFDSRTPGILEFGTVWLPLPHLLEMPFVASDSLWHNGIGASIPSLIAFIAGVLGIFRLVNGFASRLASWIAALIYALNPNLMYLQATAMTEALYLAFFIWTVVHFCEFAQTAEVEPNRARRSLELCAMTLAGAMLVRYDAWFLAVCGMIALAATIGRLKGRDQKNAALNPAIRRGARNFMVLVVLTAGLWLAYNYFAYGNALEFATGPYSARAIAERTRTPSFPTYPGEHCLRTAALYFLKASRLNVEEGAIGTCLLGIAFIALLATVYFSRRNLPVALLWAPAIFYAVTIAYGSVPLFFPQWWPHSYYNVRYGLQLLPAIAVFAALSYEFLSRFISARLGAALIITLVTVSYLSILYRGPICLREAQANGAARMAFDARLAHELRKLPPSATLMMYCGEHSGALQDAGIPFRRVLREGNHPDWEIGLSRPAQAADYIVAIEDDDVFRAVRLFPQQFELMNTIDTPHQPQAFIYRSLH